MKFGEIALFISGQPSNCNDFISNGKSIHFQIPSRFSNSLRKLSDEVEFEK